MYYQRKRQIAFEFVNTAPAGIAVYLEGILAPTLTLTDYLPASLKVPITKSKQCKETPMASGYRFIQVEKRKEEKRWSNQRLTILLDFLRQVGTM